MEHEFRLGDWLVDPRRNQLAHGDERVRLDPRVMQVLVCLAEKPGEVVSQERILEKVWAGVFVTDGVLTNAIWELRKALGDDSANPRFIQTVPKKGYRLVAEVRAPERRGSFVEAEVRSQRWARPLFALALLLIGAALGVLFRSPDPGEPLPVTRLQMAVQPAEKLDLSPALALQLGIGGLSMSRTAFAFSPDGTELVYVGTEGGSTRLFLRPMDELAGRPIPGTEGALAPFFSPDGGFVGFWADGKLMKVSRERASPVSLCETSLPFGAAWGAKGRIVFSQETGGLLQVSEEGGEPTTLTELDATRGELSHRLPYFLPGGEDLIFTVTRRGGWEAKEIWLLSLRSGERKLLIENGADGRYVPTGHLVFARLGVLMAVSFDITRREVVQGAIVLVDGVRQAVDQGNTASETGAAQFAFSNRGALAYVPGAIRPDRRDRLVWVDRTGNVEPLELAARRFNFPRISPDGTRVVMRIRTEGNDDIWVYDLARATLTRLTSGELRETAPLWTPDGARIAFASDDGIFWMPWDGSGMAARLATEHFLIPSSWTPDGATLAFNYDKPTDTDVGLLPKSGDPRPLFASPFSERFPVFSPDGHWLAYATDETGRFEVYVQPYPGLGARVQISSEGGRAPVWARNGKELFYRTPTESDGSSAMMAVDVATEGEFRAQRPRLLFRGNFLMTMTVRNYDVTLDGQRFLMVRAEPVPSEVVTEIQIVLNWFEELKHLAQTGK